MLDDYAAYWAARTPDAVAFRSGSSDLSYADLNNGADRLAGWLRANGIRRGDRVGILMRRAIELPLAVYGILRAGAVYVPLDPDAPAERLSRILAECEIELLISHDLLSAQLEAITADGKRLRAVLGVTCAPSGLAATPFHACLGGLPALPDPDRGQDDLAYVIFTSGSTGVPKGVVHTHASAKAYAEMAADLYGLTSSDRMGNHSPLHFDMSTFEYFSGPSRGACTVLLPEAYLRIPASLTDLIERERLTTLYCVPFALVQMLEHGVLHERDLSALRWIIHAGEPMSPRHLEELRQKLPRARFSNSYGPAEVNQITWYHHPDAPIPQDRSIPLGYACAHSRLRQADDGELLAATPAMMQGYWRRPDLDAWCFVTIKDPDGVERRYYRTGDVVTRDAQGRFNFVGRQDRQIKIRGVRVELDEVERVLANHPDVMEAAAIRSEDGMTVTAYVMLRPGATAAAGDLTAYAGRMLPSVCVPRDLTIVPDFPRTGTGKIDRNALRHKEPP